MHRHATEEGGADVADRRHDDRQPAYNPGGDDTAKPGDPENRGGLPPLTVRQIVSGTRRSKGCGEARNYGNNPGSQPDNQYPCHPPTRVSCGHFISPVKKNRGQIDNSFYIYYTTYYVYLSRHIPTTVQGELRKTKSSN